MKNCKFCEKECKNDNSLRNHERLCKKNPDRQTSFFETEEHKKRAKSGKCGNRFTKAKKLGLPKPEITEETRKKISDAVKKRPKELRERIAAKTSKTIREKVKNGEWHTSLAKNMHYDYNGVDLHGTWELEYAKWLDRQGIKWERCSDKFQYSFEGSERYYTPDFYLVESDEYVEIKGFETIKDQAKWNQFPSDKNLVVLFGEDLKTLGIDIKV